MAQVKPETFELPIRALWILLPPLVVMATSAALIGQLGYPLDHLARAVVQDGHAEAAGRLRMLATWLLLAAGGIASIIYCAWSIRALAPASVRLIGQVYLGLAAAGILLVAGGAVQGGQRLMDRRVICAAFDLIQAQAEPPAGNPVVMKTYERPLEEAEDDQYACGRTNIKYRQMWWLNEVQKYLLILFIPALALGILSCRALPPRPGREDCRFQVRRLNNHLYVTAAALVAGLLFLSALLHWPGFAFRGSAAMSYRGHVDAYILYWGVAYSLFIASYYVPVAIALARTAKAAPADRRRAKAGGAEAQDSDSPVSELVGQLKMLAAMFAPAIAGLLGGVVNL